LFGFLSCLKAEDEVIGKPDQLDVALMRFSGYFTSENSFLTIWNLTTPLGGDNSLQRSLNLVVGNSIEEVEKKVKDYVLNKRKKA